ncbi:MAG: flagellar basal-body rod protein FlgB [Candidatus Lindowbacteria bacterium RIFCSPLOWO2_12_FULL_62_27]|nr:MAG: flagellar basal-body rod protein FlgB [Candidatus Lindowbacteria bacterium RIFCSPLOWO2_02_FULL_62_12]OGH63149.1 MAG: flagellar basal-body rod protein FlgB [Candidatus Lindowbacteria bacterium RIFCSPLOWO2_12_FULL_62_27]
MSAHSIRHSAISQNIANADTPYYKRKEVLFEGYLRRVLYDGPKVRSSRPDGRHIPFSTEILKIRPTIHAETDSRYRNDYNNVDIDREMSILAKNQLSYNAIVSFAQSLNQTVQSVLQAAR